MKFNWSFAAVAFFAAALGAGGVWLFQTNGTVPPPPQPQPSAPASSPPPTHVPLPHMQIEAQYSGPLQDTLIQRLRDPENGAICYLYLPIAVHHTPPGKDTGYVEYGGNAVGSISCYAPLVQVRVAAPLQRPAP